ncbi:hypothetical protein VN97_g11545 [Penicillium thymicola]|uniref:Uncharacterized protein n=1 Tax=Penicillium thymicola TaxID=293382 RepID=A0AAI9T7Z1_PENTH|nr:hypothetical protein VN97_g11545 [Penicillium thymicola]
MAPADVANIEMTAYLLNNLPCLHACLLQTEPSFVCYLLFAIEQCLDGFAGYINPCISSLINNNSSSAFSHMIVI